LNRLGEYINILDIDFSSDNERVGNPLSLNNVLHVDGADDFELRTDKDNFVQADNSCELCAFGPDDVQDDIVVLESQGKFAVDFVVENVVLAVDIFGKAK
jgi:hypothetical protein